MLDARHELLLHLLGLLLATAIGRSLLGLRLLLLVRRLLLL